MKRATDIIDRAKEEAPLVLAGAGVIVYGLMRRSWAGLALAAAGGFMAYCGMRRPARHSSRLPASVPPADSPSPDRFLRNALEGRPLAAV